MSKMTICLWFDHGKAREAAEFYARLFPDSRVGKATPPLRTIRFCEGGRGAHRRVHPAWARRTSA